MHESFGRRKDTFPGISLIFSIFYVKYVHHISFWFHNEFRKLVSYNIYTRILKLCVNSCTWHRKLLRKISRWGNVKYYLICCRFWQEIANGKHPHIPQLCVHFICWGKYFVRCLFLLKIEHGSRTTSQKMWLIVCKVRLVTFWEQMRFPWHVDRRESRVGLEMSETTNIF